MSSVHPGWLPRVSPPVSSLSAAAFVKELRTKHNLSQAAMAKRSGVSQRIVSAVEIGQRRPGLAFCIALAEGMDLTPADRVRLIEAAGYHIYPEDEA